MKFPQIGEIMHDESGRRWRVLGVQLHEGVEDDHPERKTLYVDLEPIEDRPPVPEAFREAVTG